MFSAHGEGRGSALGETGLVTVPGRSQGQGSTAMTCLRTWERSAHTAFGTTSRKLVNSTEFKRHGGRPGSMTGFHAAKQPGSAVPEDRSSQRVQGGPREGRPPETCGFCHSWSRVTIFSANLTAGTHSSHAHRTSISRTDYLSHHANPSKTQANGNHSTCHKD